MHFRILPVLVLVAIIALAVRLGEFSMGMSSGGYAMAQNEVDQDVPPLPDSDENTASDKDASEDESINKSDDEDQDQAASLPARPDINEGEEVNWKDSTESEFEYSEVRQGLYKDLTERREEIESRERTLATREAILEAAERELNQKLRELQAVRDEISGLLEQQSEEEEARINSLVRIYEGMKAKDAANIFNTLDIDVLLSVISRMSERKSAPILAEMTPERARTVTILLAQQKQIPSIPPQ